MSKRISILGSTGSIGTQTLDVIAHFSDDFDVVGLTGYRNLDLLAKQIDQFLPQLVCVPTDTDRATLRAKLSNHIPEIVVGPDGLNDVAATPCDQLVVAISGTSSLAPTAAALQAGNPVALACKEVLVSGGSFITQLAIQQGLTITPIDSEHAAIAQCLTYANGTMGDVDKLVLTASGGPFWSQPDLDFDTVTPAQALKHPNWDMGGKITIDSATLMNKGLEVIEAHHLFGVSYDDIEVVIHPQSAIHSFVEFCDGTTLAQLGHPDMRHPIQYALTTPKKAPSPWPRLRYHELQDLTFSKPDTTRFPLLQLAYDAGRSGTTQCAILNAANEAAVALFLANKIPFSQIPIIVEGALHDHHNDHTTSLNDILSLDYTVKSRIIATYEPVLPPS